MRAGEIHARIQSGRRSDFFCLAVHERDVFEWYPHLERLVGSRLGERHLAFFAQPTYDADRGTLDWYASVPGNPVPLAQLAPEPRQAAESAIFHLLQDLRQLAARLRGSSVGAESQLGEMLQHAIAFPSKDQVFVVGEQPVVAFWGFVPDDGVRQAVTPDFVPLRGDSPRPVAPPVPLPPAVAPAPAPSPAPENKPRSRWRWLPAAAALLALLLLGRWFMCAALPLPLPGVVPLGEVDPSELDALRRERDGLRRELEAKLAQCRPDAVVPRTYRVDRSGRIVPGESIEVPPPLDDSAPGTDHAALEPGSVDSSVPDGPLEVPPPLSDEPVPGETEPDPLAGLDPNEPEPLPPLTEDPAQTPPGDEPAPSTKPPKPTLPPVAEAPSGQSPRSPSNPRPGAEPGQTPDPSAFPPRPPEGSELQIPETAESNQPPEFLKGDWTSESKLKEEGSNKTEDVEMSWQFDAQGRGKLTLKQSDGTLCTAAARGQMAGRAQVYIHTESAARCSDGSSYKPLKIICQRSATGRSVCTGDQGDGQTFRVQMRR